MKESGDENSAVSTIDPRKGVFLLKKSQRKSHILQHFVYKENIIVLIPVTDFEL